MVQRDTARGQAGLGSLDGGALLDQLKLVLLRSLFGLDELGLGRFKIGLGFHQTLPRQAIIQPNENGARLDRLRFAHFDLDHASGNQGIERRDAVLNIHVPKTNHALSRG